MARANINGLLKKTPDSKVHGANMGPIWGWQDPGGPHVGPINFGIWDMWLQYGRKELRLFFHKAIAMQNVWFVINVVTADVLIIIVAWSSAGTEMTNTGSSYIRSNLALKGLVEWSCGIFEGFVLSRMDDADDTFKRTFLNENVRIPIKNSLKFVRKDPINNIPAMVQIMAWCQSGDKPLPEPMVVKLPTHICFIQPKWVKT